MKQVAEQINSGIYGLNQMFKGVLVQLDGFVNNYYMACCY